MKTIVALALAAPLAAQTAQEESAYYSVDYLVPPEGERVEVGGMAFLPDGRLVLSTRRGQVWMVSDPLAGRVTWRVTRPTITPASN